jgi:hypothetical protein
MTVYKNIAVPAEDGPDRRGFIADFALEGDIESGSVQVFGRWQ